MRRATIPAALLLLALTLAADLAPARTAPAPPIAVYFSPEGGAEAAIVAEIGRARAWVRVLAYSFTSAPVADALVAAKGRGVDVFVVVDRSQIDARGSRVPAMLAAGIPVRVDRKHAIAHNKVLVVDGLVVTTGSFNFSAAAEHANAENLAVIRDPGVAALYAGNWSLHAGHSEVHPAGRSPGER